MSNSSGRFDLLSFPPEKIFVLIWHILLSLVNGLYGQISRQGNPITSKINIWYRFQCNQQQESVVIVGTVYFFLIIDVVYICNCSLYLGIMLFSTAGDRAYVPDDIKARTIMSLQFYCNLEGTLK